MGKYLIVILGPTGIGKTKTAIAIAKFFQTEIVSSDSRQIFKELKIGTAIPSKEELKMIKHHFIHSHSIHDYYNASKFETDALDKIEEILKKNDYALMTGGSMLYIDAVCKGIDDLPEVDPFLRNDLTNLYKSEGIEGIRNRLKKLDPEYYHTVDLKNPKRILHALEICIMTGKPYSSFRKNTIKKRPFQIIKIGLKCEREILYSKINTRVDTMIKNGLLDEVKRIFPYKNLQALNTVGYKELFAYIDGAYDLNEAIDKIKSNTRKYARKQLTWFKKDPAIHWFNPDEPERIIKFIMKQDQDG